MLCRVCILACIQCTDAPICMWNADLWMYSSVDATPRPLTKVIMECKKLDARTLCFSLPASNHTHTHVKRTYTHQTGQCVCCFLFPLYCKMLCVFVDFSHFLRLILRCADLFFIRFPYFSAKSLTLSQTLFSCAFCCFASGCERARASGFWVFV